MIFPHEIMETKLFSDSSEPGVLEINISDYGDVDTVYDEDPEWYLKVEKLDKFICEGTKQLIINSSFDGEQRRDVKYFDERMTLSKVFMSSLFHDIIWGTIRDTEDDRIDEKWDNLYRYIVQFIDDEDASFDYEKEADYDDLSYWVRKLSDGRPTFSLNLGCSFDYNSGEFRNFFDLFSYRPAVVIYLDGIIPMTISRKKPSPYEYRTPSLIGGGCLNADALRALS
jgi:hypothetical protein